MDTSGVIKRTTETVAAWSFQQEAAGYPGNLVRMAAERAIGAAIDKSKALSAPIYGQALQDNLTHELGLQVEWMKRTLAAARTP